MLLKLSHFPEIFLASVCQNMNTKEKLFCILQNMLTALINVLKTQSGKQPSFSKPGTVTTHSALEPLIDITWSKLSDYMQLPLEPKKAFFSLHKTCKHTLMCKIGGMTLYGSSGGETHVNRSCKSEPKRYNDCLVKAQLIITTWKPRPGNHLFFFFLNNEKQNEPQRLQSTRRNF